MNRTTVPTITTPAKRTVIVMVWGVPVPTLMETAYMTNLTTVPTIPSAAKRTVMVMASVISVTPVSMIQPTTQTETAYAARLTTVPTLPPSLFYTSDAADDLLCVDLGGRRISIKIITI